MRKLLFFAALTMAVSANAQSSISLTNSIQTYSRKGGISFMPHDFTYGDHAYFAVEHENDPNQNVDWSNPPTVGTTATKGMEYEIFDDNLKSIKSIPIYSYTVTWTNTHTDKNPMGQTFSSWADAKTWLTQSRGITNFDDANYRGNDSNNPNLYFIWDASDNMVYEVYAEYEWKASGNTNEQKVVNLDYSDYDESRYPDDDTPFTQTLFNDDEKFEYLIVEGGDIKIMQEGGTVLQTINTNFSRPGIDLIKLHNKCYLMVDDSDSYNNKTFQFYLVKKMSGTSSSTTRSSDLNNDGVVDAADVVTLVNDIVNP